MPEFGFDDWIDSQLRDVPLPADLLKRLSAECRGPSPDERLDLALKNVPVPDGLEWRLRQIARTGQLPDSFRRFSLAASVLISIGLAVLSYVGLRWFAPEPQPARIAEQSRETQPDHPATRAVAGTLASPDFNGPHEPVPIQADQPQPLTSEPLVSDDRQTVQRADVPLAVAANEDVAAADSRNNGTIAETLAAESRRSETGPMPQPVLAAANNVARLPDLDVWERDDALGIRPPRVPGYDLLFQLKHGVHPFVAPAAHPDLAATRVPLTFRTASYDLARRMVRAGQMPSPETIRVEDFLSAVDYLLPAAPKNGAALHVAGVRSPSSAEGLYAMQLVIQAARPSRPHPATRWVVVVDRSAAMRPRARFETVVQSLPRLALAMTDADRLTLVGFAEQPTRLGTNLTRSQVQALAASNVLGTPGGAASLAPAVEAARRAVQEDDWNGRQLVVFLTSGRTPFDERSLDPEQLKRFATLGIAWQVVRIAPSEVESTGDPFVALAGGTSSVANSPSDLQERLTAPLSSQPSNIANGVALKVTFNPQVVTGYRLVGHEAAALMADAGDPLTIDLHWGQNATALYELWIKPKAGASVATAELTWLDPRDGRQRRAARQLKQDDFSTAFSQAPAWLQQGLIAARTAEAMRGFYFAPAAHPFSQIIDLASQADPSAMSGGELPIILEMVRQIQKIH